MMAGNGMEKIPTPWRLYWHRFRYSTLPLIGLGSFAVCTLLLWKGQGEMPHAIGEIEAIRAEVSSPLAGILVRLPKQEAWALYETVEANQPLAQLDDRPLQAELAAFKQELDRIEKELGAVRAKLDVSEADRKLTYASDAARLWVELEQHGLIALERQAEVAVNAIEAQRRTVYYDCLKPLYDKKIVSELELNNARYLRDEAKKRLDENTKVAGLADVQKAATQTRLDKMDEFMPADIKKELAPIIQAAKVQEAKIEEVNVQIGRLTIRAPIHGMIAAIHHWPGSAIKTGDPILTIASDERRYIVCYVRQEQHVEPHVRMEVDVRKRAAIAPIVGSTVERVGPQIEPIPIHLARDPKYPEWGLPVRIALPEKFVGHPGELFEVTFKTHLKDGGEDRPESSSQN
jgi:multidrug resistance efflux pump